MMETIKARLGRCIRQRRDALGLSQEELGACIHKDEQTVYRLEKGRVWVEYATLIALGKAFGTSAERLLAEALGEIPPDPRSSIPGKFAERLSKFDAEDWDLLEPSIRGVEKIHAAKKRGR